MNDNEGLNKKLKFAIDGVIFETTIRKFKEIASKYDAVHDQYGGEVTDLEEYNEDELEFYCSGSFSLVVNFFNDFTEKELVISAEYDAFDENLGDIVIEEVSYINCECPDNLKKYYNGEIFISHFGKLLEIEGKDYKKINFDEIWNNVIEISNSGVVCSEFSDFNGTNYQDEND